LTDKDFRKIEVLKKRMAMRKVDKHGFRSDSEEKEGSGEEMSEDDEEGMESEMDEEYGEEEMEEVEEEMEEEDEAAP